MMMMNEQEGGDEACGEPTETPARVGEGKSGLRQVCGWAQSCEGTEAGRPLQLPRGRNGGCCVVVLKTSLKRGPLVGEL